MYLDKLERRRQALSSLICICWHVGRSFRSITSRLFPGRIARIKFGVADFKQRLSKFVAAVGVYPFLLFDKERLDAVFRTIAYIDRSKSGSGEIRS